MVQNFTPLNEDFLNPQSVTPTKETEPIPSQPEAAKLVLEHEPEKEVASFITQHQDVVEVPPDLEKMGVLATPTDSFPTTQQIKLPLSDEAVEQGLHQPIDSSWRWLAELAIYILKKAHLTLKTVHGKLKRVVIA